jgi:NAD(P)-dependent dehydrogenase (short-subunit alcohol dehydrogenase family)
MSQNSGAVLITGCSTGIGHATAARLARAGRTVYASARSEAAVSDLRDAGCRTLALDVTDEASMTAAVDTIVAEHGAVSALVNNAGYSQSGAVETVTPDDLRRQFETNVFGLVRLSQLVLPGMRAQHYGRIVNISSMGANFTFPGGGVYHATKYAVEALSDALRFEVRGFGVGVSVIQPGLIKTEFGATAITSTPTSDDGPYATFNADVAKSTAAVYETGLLARLGGGPDVVAQAIEKALDARRAPIRVRVTPSAHLLVLQRRLMTDRMWERFLRTQFTAPTGSEGR